MKIELLSPAGDKESFYSAIKNGADAIYLGGKNFGARAYANNFDIDDIASMIKYAHSYDVNVYVTVNTLIKDKEFNDVVSFIRQLHQANVDAILIQDIGLGNYLKQVFPNLELHCSTQMNILSVSEAKKAKEEGYSRIVVGRECSIETIKEIKENVDIEVEVFAHGALCMAYSGNCYLSSLIGKRSGNRGKCTGACRLKYNLKKKGEKINEGYFLSSKDLCTLDNVGRFIKAGVDSIKIEGRSKNSSYVSIVTKSYREAIDGSVDYHQRMKQIKASFNREFTKGYVFGEENNQISNIKAPNHQGINIGKITGFNNKYIYITLTDDIQIKDVIRIKSNDFEDPYSIFNIEIVDKNKKLLSDSKKASKGQVIRIKSHLKYSSKMMNAKVLKISDSKLGEDIKKMKEHKIPIRGDIKVENGYLALYLRYKNICIKEKSMTKIIEGGKNKEVFIRQINKMGGTHFVFSRLSCYIEEGFIQLKEINDTRRRAIKKLEEKIIENRKKVFIEKDFEYDAKEYKNEFRVYAKVRNKDQYDGAIKAGIKYIISDNQELFNLPNIIKMNNRVANKDKGITMDGKLSSIYNNVVNAYSINKLHQDGINIVGVSLELNKKEIEGMIINYKKLFSKNPNLMIMVYGYYEAMLTKHDFITKNSGKFIDGVVLENNRGDEFPVIKDGDIKILNSKPIHLLKEEQDIKKMGINNLLLDFSIESKEEVLNVCQVYLNQKNDNITNVTNGAFYKGVE